MRTSQRGQAILESVLMLAAFMVVATFVGSSFRQNEIFAQIVKAPWSRVAGLLQNGVWISPEKGMPLHPAAHARHVSTRGDSPR